MRAIFTMFPDRYRIIWIIIIIFAVLVKIFRNIPLKFSNPLKKVL